MMTGRVRRSRLNASAMADAISPSTKNVSVKFPSTNAIMERMASSAANYSPASRNISTCGAACAP